MRKSRFSENQIISILKDVEKGRAVKDVCREHSVSDATYYQWKSKYAGVSVSELARMKELECHRRRDTPQIGRLNIPQSDSPSPG